MGFGYPAEFASPRRAVSSHLVGPSLYHDLDIVIVGAGEAAIEEALALSESNHRRQ